MLNFTTLKSSARKIKRQHFLFISLFYLASMASTFSLPALFCQQSLAAAPNHSITDSDLAAAEMKLLQRTYDNDPISKRLQRLELLTFGATQYGSDTARWHNLQRYLQNKTSKRNGAGSGLDAGLGTSRTANISSSISELEKYVFKKSSPTESTGQRLNKLETKLFGKASINMPAEQRIARLQRTLGIASTRQQMVEIPFNMSPGMINPYMPDMPDPEFNQFESQMSQIFKQMQKQMQEQQGRAMPMPRQMPRRGAPQIIPQPNLNPGDKVPAYNDPNFI